MSIDVFRHNHYRRLREIQDQAHCAMTDDAKKEARQAFDRWKCSFPAKPSDPAERAKYDDLIRDINRERWPG